MASVGEAAPNVPPHSVEAEQAVLGALLQDNSLQPALAVALGGDDAWYVAQHRWIWQACTQLIAAGQPADLLTVHDALASAEKGEVVGLVYLNGLVDGMLSVRMAGSYAGIVAHHARCRRAMAVAHELLARARTPASQPQALQAALHDACLALEQLAHGQAADSEPKRVSDLLPEWMGQLEDRAAGKTDAIPTGLAGCDRVLADGLRRGELVVIGARPSMGKSAAMLTITRAVSQTLPVLVCSLEDSDMMLVSRLVSAAGRCNLADIRRPARAPERMWSAVADGAEELAGLHLYLDDTPGLRLPDIERKASQVRRRAGDLGLVVVDYLQLMEGDGENRAYELTAIARGLKRLAKRMHCAVLVLSQLNREADKLDGPPRLDHLAESDGLQQAADIVGLLWRAARRKPTPENKHEAQIEFAKNKNGACDTVQLFFDGATQRFADLEAGYEQ